MKPLNVDSASTRRQAVQGMHWSDCDNKEYNARVTDAIVAERDRLLAVNKTLVEALEKIADSETSNCQVGNMKGIARAALKAGKGE